MNKISTAMVLILYLMFSSVALTEDSKPAQIVEHNQESWMHDLMKGERVLSGTLKLERFKDPVYIVLRDLNWKPNNPENGVYEVTVPEGFVTDLASIPPIFYAVLRPDDKYAHAAVVHDYLYWKQNRSRREADRILLSAMEDLEVSKAVRLLIYRAVRWGGGNSWERNRKSKEDGGQRILSQFPQDPKITWKIWMEKPDVFK